MRRVESRGRIYVAIVGGLFSGLNRAISHSLAYLGAYLVVGLPAALGMGLICGDTELGDLNGIFLVVRVLSVILLLPAAVIANFTALGLFRPRSWRHQGWRAWVAGSLGPPFCWGGMILWPRLSSGPPDFVRTLCGGWGEFLYGLGVAVLFSNLALLIAWIVPLWGKRAAPGEISAPPSLPSSQVP